MTQLENLLQQKFGKLLIEKRVQNKYGRVYWLCRCECGNTREVSSHNLKTGKVKSCGCSRIGINKGSKHGLWTGEKPKYNTLHIWINRNKPHSKFCKICGRKKKTEAANISGQYKRDINDFEWLCRRCHMITDGRYEKYSLGTA